MEVKENGKRKAVVSIAAILVLAIACIALVNCSNESGLRSGGAQPLESIADARTSNSAEAASDTSVGEDADEGALADTPDQQPGAIFGSSGETTSQDAVSGHSGDSSQAYLPTEETPPTSAPVASEGESQKQPVWVVDYEDIWVEDSPAWDELMPIHGYTDVSICNICGADITGNTAAHGKQHMLAGEGSGHHSEVRETVVGYEAIHHEAVGHWERVEAGGHWK